MKKLISITMVVLMLVSCSLLSVSAKEDLSSPKKVTVTFDINGVKSDKYPSTLQYGAPLKLKLEAESGHSLDDIVILMNGVDVTDLYFDKTTGILNIDAVTGPIQILTIDRLPENLDCNTGEQDADTDNSDDTSGNNSNGDNSTGSDSNGDNSQDNNSNGGTSNDGTSDGAVNNSNISPQTGDNTIYFAIFFALLFGAVATVAVKKVK